jgi:hypothetical protein
MPASEAEERSQPASLLRSVYDERQLLSTAATIASFASDDRWLVLQVAKGDPIEPHKLQRNSITASVLMHCQRSASDACWRLSGTPAS